MPCFFKFAAAFWVSHSNCIIVTLYLRQVPVKFLNNDVGHDFSRASVRLPNPIFSAFESRIAFPVLAHDKPVILWPLNLVKRVGNL